MKNYYDELEVSRQASPEIISRAYKLLAKKYHPDTTKLNKQIAEERFKKISEAYETLSNDEKRKEYDNNLKITDPQISKDDYDKLLRDNQMLNQQLSTLKSKINNLNSYSAAATNTNNNQVHHARPATNYENKTTSAYNTNKKRPISYLDILKYKLKILFKSVLALFLTILIISTAFYVLLQIPATKDFILNDMGFKFLVSLF